MAEAKVTEKIEVPTSKIWNLIKDFGDLSGSPAAVVIKLEGEGVGMIRHVEGGDMGFLRNSVRLLTMRITS